MTDSALCLAAIEAATGGSVPRFAALLGVHHSQVYRWANGTRTVPPWAVKIAGAILADPNVVVALASVA